VQKTTLFVTRDRLIDMVETRTRRRLRLVMVLVAFGLVGGTTWPLVADPATGPVAAIGQLLAVGGAVATLLVTASVVRSGRATDADGPSPDAAVGVLGSMTVMFAVTSASRPGDSRSAASSWGER
jgi:hypothetical protein